MSPGLQRARAPFRVQNALLGVGVAAVAIGIWYYSISAVRQETFDDLDAEARALARPAGTNVGLSPAGAGSADTGIVTANASLGSLATGATPVGVVAQRPVASGVPVRGVLSPLLDRSFPRLLDPTRKTLVWGAPPVDAPGKVVERPS
jgi:cytochrome c oxidase assembly factor 3